MFLSSEEIYYAKHIKGGSTPQSPGMSRINIRTFSTKELRRLDILLMLRKGEDRQLMELAIGKDEIEEAEEWGKEKNII